MRPLARSAALFLLLHSTHSAAAKPQYAWRLGAVPSATLEATVAPPAGYTRTPSESGSWAEWLRNLPMKPVGAPVLLHTGEPKWRQDVHAAVVDIDVGKRDLQQCADAVMRLRGEWLFASERTREIGFNYTDGKRRAYASAGKPGYQGFRRYMDQVFAYAGTYSLDRELTPASVEDIRIGDVFIKGGFPGHAVLVIDMAVSPQGDKRFLLAQSYMPAQEIHVLKNPSSSDGSPWYGTDFGAQLVTPEWNFSRDQLKRWPQ